MDSRLVVLGLGSNLGARSAALRAAVCLLERSFGCAVVARSDVYVTAPLGPAQPDFHNAAVAFALPLAWSAGALVARCLAVEAQLGRVRVERYGPRTIDVDVLWAEGLVDDDPACTLPHPRLHERAFALAPLLELAPAASDRSGRAYAAALAALPREGLCRLAPLSEFAPAVHAFEHTADEGFEVLAADRADALAAATEALGALMVDPRSVAPRECRLVEVARDALGAASGDAPGADSWPDDERAYAWLSEVLFHLDAERFALRHAVLFDDASDGATLRGALVGEPLDPARHEVHGALKAVTYHALEAGPCAGALDAAYRIQVVVDV